MEVGRWTLMSSNSLHFLKKQTSVCLVVTLEFRKIIQKARRKAETLHKNHKGAFLPFNFNSLLSYLNEKTNREALLEQVMTSN